jgi:hypothetical protein
MSLEELLSQAREYDMIVISPTELWPSPWVTSEVKTTLQEHQQDVQQLLELGDSRLCPNIGLHKERWVYIGRRRWICKICEELNKEALATQREVC